MIDPDDIDDYLARGGYAAARKALTGDDAGDDHREIRPRGLRGRGGAGFPTGIKWQFGRECRRAT